MSSKVYYHKPLAPDELLGRVAPDGRVFQSRPGPDRLIGRVDLDSGRIYASRLGPDRYVGRVSLDSGKVHRHKPVAFDEYVGRVDSDGQLYRHRPLARDIYIGKAVPVMSYAHAGAAFLLLALPAWQAAQPMSARPAPGG
jgi:hypothetical protein